MTNSIDNRTTDPLAERKRIIRGRNIALGLILAGMAALFYFITLSRITA